MSLHLFIDESGDHTRCRDINEQSPGKRYLGVVGIVLDSAALASFRTALVDFKCAHLVGPGAADVVLHREDIVAKRGRFSHLRDAASASRFDDAMLRLLSETRFTIIGAVVDKATHFAKPNRKIADPYHYAVEIILERFKYLLETGKTRGDVTSEPRGGKEDRALRERFRELCTVGGYYLSGHDLRRLLLKTKLEMSPKKSNPAGLQLADLLAHPVTREILHNYGRCTPAASEFWERLRDLIVSKYNRHRWNGSIDGYGRKLLD